MILELKNISKVFENNDGYKIHLIKNVSFFVKENEIVSIIAPLNSGKSSLLKIAAGLDEASSGSVEKNRFKSVLIPSEPSSFPWLSVTDNLKESAPDISEKDLKEILTLVGLSGYENHFPLDESVGFRFLISVARALAVKAEFILLDDNFSNVGAEFKTRIFNIIKELKSKKNISFIFATASISDALEISNRIYLMNSKPAEIIAEFVLDKADKNRIRKEIEEKLFVNENSTKLNFMV